MTKPRLLIASRPRAEDAAAQAVSCPEGMPMANDYGYNTSCSLPIYDLS
jgi:hypothetical protein